MPIILRTPLMHYRHLAGLHPKEYIPQLRCKENKEKVKKKKRGVNNFHILKNNEMTDLKGFTSGNII